MKKYVIWSVLLCALLVVGYYLYNHSIHFTGQEVDFNSGIKPILNRHCTTCHGGVKKLGNLSLLFEEDAMKAGDSENLAIIPGDAENSELYKRISSQDEYIKMPPEGPGLTTQEIEQVRNWINQGAKWGKHWAYKTIDTQPSPQLNANLGSEYENWIQNDIDRFVFHGLQRQGLTPNDRASMPELARRTALDLIGLPPNAQQVAKLQENPEKFEAYVDSLLNSPHYGERWAAMWMDLARYADSKGYEKDGHREIWAYRDWLIKAFNQDMPFNQFTIEQLAGDLLPNPAPEQYIATAFHRNTMTNTEGGTDNEEFRVTAVIDRVNTTWETWMGTSISCAQCHNHPYDPFTQTNYYENYAFFNNTSDQDLDAEIPNLKLFDSLTNQEIEAIKTWVKEKSLPSKANAQEKYYEQLIHFTEPKITLNHCSKQVNHAVNIEIILQYHGGYAVIPHIDLTDKDKVLINFSHTTPGNISIYLDSLKRQSLGTWPIPKARGLHQFNIRKTEGIQDLYIHFDYENKNYREVSSGIRWLLFYKSLPGKSDPNYANIEKSFLEVLQQQPKVKTPVLLENVDFLARPSHVFERGNWLVHGEKVSPSPPPTIPPIVKKDSLSRLEFAKWMVDPQNPLTARVFVNRVWEQLFGNGIVLTTEDFGTQGEWPTHPELLDWLAYRFMHKHNWHLKPLLKDIILSTTYQQSSLTSAEKQNEDPQNRWLSRGPRFRLSAEQIRDQALAVSGLLNEDMYGPSVMPPQPEGIWQVVYSSAAWKTAEGPDRYRRALYTYWKRTSPYPSMITFDTPSREFCVSRRIRTNTPLQALVTLNDPVYLEAAQVLTLEMLELEKSTNINAALNEIYKRLLFKEMPSSYLESLVNLYEETQEAYQSDIEAAEEVWKNSYQVRNLEKPANETIIQYGAMLAVANALLNLDEVLTKG